MAFPIQHRALSFPAALLILGTFVASCSDSDTPTPDGGTIIDGSTSDASTDGGGHDAGRDDGGASDAGASDASGPGDFTWPVPTSSIAITPSPYWKNRISAPNDPFLSRAVGQENEVRWIKFAVLMRDPSKVYFQDSSQYPFHYEFITELLDPFLGKSRAEVDAMTLHETGQEIILGAVLFPPEETTKEYAIQLVRNDAYHPEMVRIVHNLVVSSIDAPSGTQPFYFPTFEQVPSATQWKEWLAARNVLVSSVERWLNGNSCYAKGWALGKIVFVTGSQIGAAYVAGSLKPTDILLTDGVPAEVPYVAGILSLAPSTPNSHVAILATSYGVPFAYLARAEDRALANALVGREVVLRAEGYTGTCSVKILDVEGQLTPMQRQEILALKAPPPLAFPAKETRGALSANTDTLTEADAKYFGGKASNFGLLRRTIPNNSPEAIAFSFDLWDLFMDQTMPSSGRTLRQEIEDRLGGFTYPPDMLALDQALLAVRGMIETQTVFSTQVQQEVLTALSGFDPMTKLRFRSSTNVEVTDAFTCAGLYDSKSACLADDLDSDEVGPSLCNPTKADERGVFRAIRQVYASFYNDNAFLERLRHGVDESQVGMALLVHYSFPDDDELANGVGTLMNTQYSKNVKLVTQKGAVSVTNPAGGAIPEVVDVYVGTTGVYPSVTQGSSLVPLGATVMTWPTDYEDLTNLLTQVADAYATLHPGLTRFDLDYEYKKVASGALVVKQVRRIPLPDTTANVPVFLVNEPTRFCTFQGEAGDVYANHRLKQRLDVMTKNLWLTEASLAASFYDTIDIEYLEGTSTASRSGDPATWTGAQHSFDGMTNVRDGWVIGSGPMMRTYAVEISISRFVRPAESPLRSIRDYAPFVRVDYATPVATLDWQGISTTSTEYIRLGSCPEDTVITPAHPFVEDRIDASGITFETSYYWPPPPTGITAGYTAPLVKWGQTTITGLTAQPIVLTSDYAQTYRPAHHNFGADYIFDPWMEPGIDQGILDELQSVDIRFLHVSTGGQIYVMGLDGTLRAY